mgnify:CR=1 FL=1
MYLHIGNNNIVEQKDLIAIYNIETIKETEEYKRIIEDLENKHLLIKEEGMDEKPLIIIKKDDNIIGYISNISSTTIAKRTEKNINQN